MAEYPAPVDRLLKLGAETVYGSPWLDYPKQFGLGPEHVPDLIRMATDVDLHEADDQLPLIYAPIHAWRALGQLRAEAAIEPLLEALAYDEEQGRDLASENMPAVFRLIGPSALPALQAYAAAPNRTAFGRGAATSAMEDIAKDHPETRTTVVASLVRFLEDMERNDRLFNAFLIQSLENLDAKEAAPLVEKAYSAGLVEETFAGTHEHARWAFGPRDTPEPRRFVPFLLEPDEGSNAPRPAPVGTAAQRPRNAKERAQARRKKAAKDRKRNRKKR